MKAKIKRLLVLILVSAMIINSDMLYLAMGIEMLFVNAAENEDLEEIKQDNQENLQDEPEDGQQENSQEAPEMNTPVQNPPKFMVSNRATSIIPTTAAGLQGMGTTFTLSTYQDLINLQKLSQTTSLEGYTFTFLKILDEENQAQWNFSKASVDGAGYIGIGNEAYPFKGTLNTYVNGMVCTINKPVCNYVCTGATFEGFNFNSNNAKASLAEYLVTSEGSTVKGVQLKNITVGGTIGSSSTSVSGGLFAYIENKTTSPIELVLTENAADSVYSVKMTAGVHGTYAGGIVGVVNSDAASTGAVSIISKLSVVTGTVNGYGSGAAGGIVGKMGPNSVLKMETNRFVANVTGKGNNGGAVGLIEKALFTTNTEMTVNTSVTSTNNMTAGGLVGRSDDAVKIEISNVTLNGTGVTVNNKNQTTSFAGGIIGYINDTAATTRGEVISFKNIGLINSTVTGYDKGGVVGNINADNVVIDTVTVNNQSKIGDTADGLGGGIVGRVKGRNILLTDVTVDALQICAYVRGGIVGGSDDVADNNNAVWDTQLRINNASVSTDFSKGHSGGLDVGGLIGRAQKGSLVSVSGNINIVSANFGSAGTKGYILGEQRGALVYFEENIALSILGASGVYDNAGNYGSIFVNSNALIKYDAAIGKNVSGVVAGSGTSEDPYKITSKEDMMRLAIVLNTDGAFGADCFNVAPTRDGAKALRSAHFEITNSIDLSGTGVQTLSRNDKYAAGDTAEYAFKGSFSGSNNSIVITFDSHNTNQTAIGLFPSISNASFKNLTIQTKENSPWRYAKHAAGIAPFVYGKVSLDNVTSKVHLVARQENTEYYYGAMFGKITLDVSNGATVTSKDIVLNATIEDVRLNQYVGGLAALVIAQDANAGSKFTLNGNTTISNKFTFKDNFGWKISYAGGLIGVIKTQGIQNKTFVTLTAENVMVDNQILDYSGARYVYNGAALGNEDVGYGSFIGHYWDNVEADFEKITVTGDKTCIKATVDKGRYGALFGKISGKLYLHDVDFLSGTFENSVDGSSLLVSNGKWLLMLLDEYTIDPAKVNIVNAPARFDEIMGMNIGNEAKWGGIVSIKNDNFRTMSEAGYVNQVLPVNKANNFTRYHYNLFEQSPSEYTVGMIENNVINTPAKLMVWHLNQYVSNELERFIKIYFGTGSNSGEGNVTRIIDGKIDLRGYSYYPTPLFTATLEGKNNAEIIFHGDTLAQNEEGKMPANVANQQYRMHSGLLYDPNGPTVKNMELSGSITNLGADSGAIAVKACTTMTLENIVLDGLHVTNYNGTDHRVGLLLSYVWEGATVNLKGIKMTGYSDTVYGLGAGQNKYAASALIGRVGDSSYKNVKISFSQMEIPYVRKQEDSPNAPVKTESPLKYASFIDIYQYTQDMDLYTGQGLYLFTQAEYNANKVTLGKEIKHGVMYGDNMTSLPEEVRIEAGTISAQSNLSNYLPYVCDTCSDVTIQVNPKRGDFIEGCGTYEDPYVLRKAKQVFQLYQYLSPKSVNNDAYLSGWKVNQYGIHGSHVELTYGDENFPTREQMRTAYYVVAETIDLTSISDVNDYGISNDFDGIGSSTYPFSGVIYGQGGVQQKIILPGNEKGRSKTNYGLFNCIKGAVIKDLHITTMTAAEPEKTKKDDIFISQNGGGVAAKIIGGDNIIDNVKVSTKLIAGSNSTLLGGYVGLVEKGSLIVRNLNTDNLSSFKPCIITNSVEVSHTTDKVSAIAGKVQDGFILYEGKVNGAENSTDKILTAAKFGFADGSLELSKTFPMVNAGYLDAKAGTEKIQINIDDASKTSTITLKNDAHLQIIAMALNSDGLSSVSTHYVSGYNGYDERAICRKAQYSSMESASTEDGALANQYDKGVYNFPYLISRYFTINGEDSKNSYQNLYVTVNGAKISKLNKLSNATDYTTTYQLVNGTYDMTGYGYAFRGLGELYNISYSRFNANFDGNGSTIVADMTAGYDTAVTTTALFNDLNSSAYCLDMNNANTQNNVIKNFVAEGSFVNNQAAGRVGVVAGSIYGNWTFDNITLSGVSIKGKVNAGGIVGKIANDTDFNAYNVNNPKYVYQFTNCKLLAKTDGVNTYKTTIVAENGNAGGILGIVSTDTDNAYLSGGKINLKGNQTNGLEVSSNTGAAGGLIGYVANTVILEATLENNTISNATVLVKGNGKSAGGAIGTYIPVSLSGNLKPSTADLKLKNNVVENVTVSIATAYNANGQHGVGGLVGNIYPRVLANVLTTVTLENNQVKDANLGVYDGGAGNTITTVYPVGGLIGTLGGDSVTITDCRAYNSVNATTPGAGVYSSAGTDVGGFVGRMDTTTCTVNYTHSADLTDETQMAAGVDAAVENLNIIGLDATTTRGTRVGGLFGVTSGKNCLLDISGVKVRNCILKTANTYVGENQTKCGAGGLIGVVATLYNVNIYQTEVTYENILVTGTDIEGYMSGGLVGNNSAADAECYNVVAKNIAVRQNNILGQGAGGIFGGDHATGRDGTNNYKNILVDNNKIGAKLSTYDYIWAGGFSGRVNNSGLAANRSAKQYYNEVVISNNYIVGYSSAYANIRIGGMFGLLSDGTGSKDFFIYNPIIKNNYIGIWNNGEDIATYNMVALKTITEDKVGLIKYDTTTGKLTIINELPDTLKEEDIQLYATNIGSIAGKMMTGFRVLVLKPEITFAADKIRPVVDCGIALSRINGGTQVDGNYSITDNSIPYSYRDLFNVIYFEPEAVVSTAGNKIMNAFAGSYGETEYLFDSLESIIATYKAVDNTVADTDDLLNAYRLNIFYKAANQTQHTIVSLYEKAYYNGSSDPTVILEKGVTEDLVGIPLIVYDAQNGTAAEVLNGFVQALTNSGGTLNNRISGITSVKAKRAFVKNGVITLDTSGGTPSIISNGVNLAYNHYDTYNVDKGTSITILEISYGWTTALGETVRETIYLPVYVLERLDVRTFIRMSEGAVYDFDSMKNSTIGDGTRKQDVIMANDTTYTLAIEFLYSSGRKKFENETVNKIIKLQEDTVSGKKGKALPVGTKLTLIDVETGYAYYYEATTINQEAIKLGTKNGIPFTDFRRVPLDSSTSYKIRTMAEVDAINSSALQASYVSFDDGNKIYNDVGVERYLLIVDGSKADTENALFDITVVADEKQNNNSKDIYPADIINITSIPGLKVGFEGKGTKTTIAGMMMRNQEVMIHAVYGIKAQKLAGQGSLDEAPYWIMASSNEVIDSANNSKYLELAIYLQDTKGNRITLPQNTNISMNGQVITASGSQSVFYFYKDTNDAESLDGITGDMSWEADIRLGFETAVLDSYNDEYSVVIELLRTDSPAYPMSGDKPDYYGEEISARIQTDLAIAVLPNDSIDLGINTYLEEKHSYEIPFTAMIDFGSVIEFGLEGGEEVVNAQLTKWCDETKYQISYRLYRKVQTKNGKEYIPADNSRISLWKADKNAKDGYSAMRAVKDQNGQTVYTMDRSFSRSDVQKATNAAKGLMTEELMLKINTEGINDAELSNYKLEMSVIAYDAKSTTGPTGEEAVLQDFFIFTIAKLKTDME